MTRWLILVVSLALYSQTYTARITGTVSDPSGAPVAHANLKVVQTETNATRTIVVSDSGVYSVPLLMPGVYEVTLEAAGFQTQVRRQIRLEVNQTLTLDFPLRIADAAATVDVTADVPVLQSETSNVGLTLDTKTIQDLPLQERDVMGALRLIPGVVTRDIVGQARGGRSVFNSDFSVGGGRTSTNEVLLDGSVNTIGDFNGVVFVPPPDTVQEFRVEVNTFSAEFGRTGGGVVNMITKAGTNKYHGTAFYLHQNDAFNANSFINNRFATPKPVLRRHQYGFTLGGPVVIPRVYMGRNKTFFFTAFEGRRENDPVRNVTSVPTELERRGDFSATRFLAAAGPTAISIFDPATSRVSGTMRVRDPFPDNAIPASRINAISRRLVDQYPQANRQGSSVTGRQNFLYQGLRTYSRDVFTSRVDHYVSDRHRVFGRFSWQENLDTNPSTVVRFTNSNSVYDTFYNGALDDTFQITPRLFNTFRYMYARFHANQISNTLGFDPTTLGFPAYVRDSANVLFFPNVSMGDFPDLGGTAFNNNPRDTQGVQNNLIYAAGKHSLKMGGEYRLYRYFFFQVSNPTGIYSFSKNFTQPDQIAANRPEQGLGFASLLLGTGNFNYERVDPVTSYKHYAGAYIQDDWKVSRKVTLNLGLRWETETGTGEAHDRLTYFDPNAANGLTTGPKGAIVFTGGNNPRTLRAMNWRNFGPRAGVAYRFTPKTALRAGYGLYFLPLGVEPAIVTTPFNFTAVADVLNADYTPKTTISDPFPGGITRPGSTNRVDDGSYRLSTNSNTVLRDQPASYLQQWNVAVGRQLNWATVIDATYYGSRGVHLPIPSLELNQIDPVHLARGGTYLTELVPNPYFGQIRTGLLSQQRIPRMQLLKPYPQFANPTTANAFGGSLNYLRPPVGDSVYHAVTFKFERRFTKGIAFTAHYTISKLLDTGGAGNGAAFRDPSALRDIYNIRLERSVGSFDIPQRVVMFWSVDLPFGKGKRWLNGGGWTNQLLGGWNLFSFQTFEAGLPVNIGGPDLSRLAGASPSRASVVPGVDARYALDQSIANARQWDNRCGCTPPWFNPAAFRATPEFQIPDGPRFLPNVRGAWYRNMDTTVVKSVRVNERFRLRLEGHFFNLLNQVTFTGPSVITVTSANFGSAGGTRDNARRIEAGAKLIF